MNDENRVQELFDSIGLTDEERQRVREVARVLAARVRIALEEAAELLSVIIQEAGAAAETLADAFLKLREELEECGAFDIEPRAQRRKRERSRARSIEQQYRAEIRRCERERPYRRIYKPP